MNLTMCVFWIQIGRGRTQLWPCMVRWMVAIFVYVAHFWTGCSQGPMRLPPKHRPEVAIFGPRNSKIPDLVGVHEPSRIVHSVRNTPIPLKCTHHRQIFDYSAIVAHLDLNTHERFALNGHLPGAPTPKTMAKITPSSIVLPLLEPRRQNKIKNPQFFFVYSSRERIAFVEHSPFFFCQTPF